MTRKAMRVPVLNGTDPHGTFDVSQLPAEGPVHFVLGSEPLDRVLGRSWLVLTWEEPDPPNDASAEEWRARVPQDLVATWQPQDAT